MAVRYGIVCEWCRKLHLIPSQNLSSRMRYERSHLEFTVKCILPCTHTIHFQSGTLLPYIVTERALQLGYADVYDRRPVTKIG
jgi:hypothetical protein